MMLADSHAHLDMLDDPDGAVERARAASVELILNPSVDDESFGRALAIAAKHEGVWAAFGVHPERTRPGAKPLPAAEIAARAAAPKAVAIGETGLDYHYEGFSKRLQKASFAAHIEAAQITGKPLIVHSRDADADMAKMLKQAYLSAQFSAILHCFAGGEELLEAAVALGLYVSASGIITYPSAAGLRTLFARVPQERLLIETDSPFLAPQSQRGKPNEPAYVAAVAEALAKIKGTTAAEMGRITTENFRRVFKV